MYDKEKLIRYLVKNNENNANLVDEIVNCLKRADKISKAVQLRQSDIDAIKKRHKVELESAENHYNDIIDRCVHEITTFHGDPSGGRDTSIECDICGKEITKQMLASRKNLEDCP